MSAVRCPVPGCAWENSLKRVLAHIRSFHDVDQCPEEFIREYDLQQCPRCRKWYLKLQQHLSSSTCSTVGKDLDDVTGNVGNDDVTGDGEVGRVTGKGNVSELLSELRLASSVMSDDRSRNLHDIEREAWFVVESLPVADILNSLPPQTILNIP